MHPHEPYPLGEGLTSSQGWRVCYFRHAPILLSAVAGGRESDLAINLPLSRPLGYGRRFGLTTLMNHPLPVPSLKQAARHP